jgi:hypothetical protein
MRKVYRRSQVGGGGGGKHIIQSNSLNQASMMKVEVERLG